VLLERPGAELLEAAERLLRARVADAEVVVVDAPRGAIARTSSGKPRRRELWRAYGERTAERPVTVATTGGSA
jgi:hypothetical protein